MLFHALINNINILFMTVCIVPICLWLVKSTHIEVDWLVLWRDDMRHSAHVLSVVLLVHLHVLNFLLNWFGLGLRLLGQHVYCLVKIDIGQV